MGTWTRTAASPLQARTKATTVWTGREVLVFGGTVWTGTNVRTKSASSHLVRDGAAYDPVGDTWRPIASTPSAWPPGPTAVVDRTVYLLKGHRGAQELWSYSPEKDRWRRLAEPLATAGSFDGIVATRSGLFAWQRLTPRDHPSEDQVYDIDTGTWSRPPANPRAVGEDRRVTSTPDGRVVSVGVPYEPDWHLRAQGPRPLMRASILDPDAARWRPTGTGDLFLGSYFGGWGAAGGMVVRASTKTLGDKKPGDAAGRGPTGALLDPVSGTWIALPGRPSERQAGQASEYDATAWGGDYAIFEGWALDVPHMRWQVVPRLPHDDHGRSGATWVGRSLFLDGWLWTPGPTTN